MRLFGAEGETRNMVKGFHQLSQSPTNPYISTISALSPFINFHANKPQINRKLNLNKKTNPLKSLINKDFSADLFLIAFFFF